MKVLHLVPSAFEYYDDIRSRVSGWLNHMPEFGVEVEVVTIYYGTTAQGMKKQTAAESPKSKFIGRVETGEVVSNWGDYDLIHWHCPFMGGARHFLDAVISHPDIPLVVTVHRLPRFGDILEIVMYWYNRYWLRKILRVATAVALVDPNLATEKWVRGAVGNQDKVFAMYPEVFKDQKKFTPRAVAEHLVILYNSIVQRS